MEKAPRAYRSQIGVFDNVPVPCYMSVESTEGQQERWSVLWHLSSVPTAWR